MITRLPLQKPFLLITCILFSTALFAQSQNNTDSLYHYWMMFPADIQSDCASVLDSTDAMSENFGCGLLAVGSTDERFENPDNGGCYQIHRTYRVINWCEYNGQSTPVVVSRDWDYWNGTNPGRCDQPRPDGNNTPGDNAIYVYVKRDLTDGLPDTVWYDSDNDPYSGMPDNPVTDTLERYWWRVISGSNDPSEEDYYEGGCSTWSYDRDQMDSDIAGNIFKDDQDQRYGSFGYWLYTQHITIYDQTAPQVNIEMPDTIFAETEADCGTTIFVPITVSDSCANTGSDPDVQILIDLFNDGADLMDVTFFWDGSTFANRYTLGEHKLIVLANDGCGNLTRVEKVFTIADNIAPTPICFEDIVVELNLQGSSTDVFAEVLATDLIASNIFDCTGQSDSITQSGNALITDYSINIQGDLVARNQTSQRFDCSALDSLSIPVEVHAWDNAGNNGFCVVNVKVQDNQDLCSVGQVLEFSGRVFTEKDKPLENVEMIVSGGVEMVVKTDAEGKYIFPLLSDFRTIRVTPLVDADARIGVSTADLIRIQKHILGIDVFSSPYLLLAADLDQNERINFIDLIRIRKMILGLETGEDLPKQWYFIPKDFQFEQPDAPWSASIQEYVELLTGFNPGNIEKDFIAVKIGDANYSLSGNVEGRSDRKVRLSAKNQELEPGQLTSVEIKIDNQEKWDAAQFGLVLDDQHLELLSYEIEGGLSEAVQLDYGHNTAIKTIWIKDQQVEKVLTLHLRAKQKTTLSKSIQLNDRLLNGEVHGHQIHPLDLVFDADEEAIAYQIMANPFVEQTELRFTNAIQGEIQVFDLNGRQVWTETLNGESNVLLQKRNLGPAGIYMFTVRTKENTWTGKLICQ